MKKLIFVVLLTIGYSLAYSQKDMRDGRNVFNYDVILTPCLLNGTATGAAAENINANTIFTIRNIVGNNYIIQISKFTSGNATATSLNNSLYKSTAGVDIFFILSQADYSLNAERLEKRGQFTIGAATTLIKIRPGKKEPKDGYDIYSEFGNDFNIGISAGYKFKPYRRLQVAHSLVGGLSFSSIKVTPYTTKNFISSESTQACVTFSLGYVFEYNKFQVSVFSGLDVMSGEIGRNWIYKNRPWMGLGFGYQIFRGEGETSN
jgi:hypothetical protein